MKLQKVDYGLVRRVSNKERENRQNGEVVERHRNCHKTDKIVEGQFVRWQNTLERQMVDVAFGWIVAPAWLTLVGITHP